MDVRFPDINFRIIKNNFLTKVIFPAKAEFFLVWQTLQVHSYFFWESGKKLNKIKQPLTLHKGTLERKRYIMYVETAILHRLTKQLKLKIN